MDTIPRIRMDNCTVKNFSGCALRIPSRTAVYNLSSTLSCTRCTSFPFNTDTCRKQARRLTFTVFLPHPLFVISLMSYVNTSLMPLVFFNNHLGLGQAWLVRWGVANIELYPLKWTRNRFTTKNPPLFGSRNVSLACPASEALQKRWNHLA